MRRDWISTRVGALGIGVAIFAIGGATRWAQALVTIVIMFALAPLVQSRRTFAKMSPLVILIGLALILTAIQLVPLPHGLVEWLSPTESGLRDDGAALFELSPRSTITYDVPATLRGLGFFVILLGVAVLALRTAVSEGGRYRVLALVAGLCGLAAIVGDLHTLLGASKLYGVIAPQEAGPRILGPLFNSNHFACLMALGALIAGGLVMYRRQRSWLRVCWLVVSVTCALTALATLSRGASIALAAGGFVMIGISVAQRWLASDDAPKRRSKLLTSSLPIGVVVVCAVVVVLYAGAEGISQQLSSTSITELDAPRSKFVAWRSATALVDESPWVGIGRGALEPVFVRVHPASAYATYPYLENEYLQAVVDWGVPGALLLGVATVWLVLTALRRWRDGPLVAGALGGLAAVMLQSNVDFGLELLGVAAPVTAVAATLVYVPLREATPRARAVIRGLRVVHIAALAIVGGLLLSSVTTTIDEDHKALGDQRDATLNRLRAPMERHPLDYFNYAVAAEVMIKHGDRNAFAVLNHAMRLHPTHPGLHLIAGRLLLGLKHPEQAATEYATALPAVTDRHKVIVEIVKLFPPPIAANALGVDPQRLDDVVRTLDELQKWDVELPWLEHVLELRPELVHACDALFQLAGKHPAFAPTILAAMRCTNYEPSRDDRIGLSRALLTSHMYPEVVRLMKDVETWQDRTSTSIDAWLLLCDAYSGLANWEEARRCLRRLDSTGVVSPERENDIASRLETVERSQRAAATKN